MPSKRKNEEEHASRSVAAAGNTAEERVTMLKEKLLATLSKESVALHAELERQQAALTLHCKFKAL